MCAGHRTDKEDKLLFGLLRVASGDKGGSMREKFIYVRFVGSKVSASRKARMTTSMGKCDAAFPLKHLSYDLAEDLVADDKTFGDSALVAAFLRVGGAHKPDYYEFGPGHRVATDTDAPADADE